MTNQATENIIKKFEKIQNKSMYVPLVFCLACLLLEANRANHANLEFLSTSVFLGGTYK